MSILIVVEGTLKARIGSEEVTLRGGEAVFVGPEVSHELWNDEEEPAVGILLMFCEGA